jgi:small conductance mechanosensitive channel
VTKVENIETVTDIITEEVTETMLAMPTENATTTATATDIFQGLFGETATDIDLAHEVAAEAEKLSGMFSDIGLRIKGYLPSLLFALLILVAGLMLSKALVGLLTKGLKKTNMDKTARSFLKSLLEIVCYVLTAVIALSLLGVPMTSIITIIGAAGLAIGLALQNSIANIAGGFIILFSRPFKAGDTVEASGIIGKVESITILHTKLITFDNKTVFIPNGKVSAERLINYTQRTERRLDLDLEVSSDSDIDKVKELLLGIVAKNELALEEPAPLVRVAEYKKDAAIIHLRVWTKTGNHLTLQYDITESMKKVFDENSIELPVQQIKVTE